jgi:hypothetical protein
LGFRAIWAHIVKFLEQTRRRIERNGRRSQE